MGRCSRLAQPFTWTSWWWAPSPPDPARKLTTRDLVSGDDHFFAATGITHGDFLGGIRYLPTGAVTHSLAMRSRSGTVRTIQAQHRWERLTRISAVPYRGPEAAGGR